MVRADGRSAPCEWTRQDYTSWVEPPGVGVGQRGHEPAHELNEFNEKRSGGGTEGAPFRGTGGSFVGRKVHNVVDNVVNKIGSG